MTSALYVLDDNLGDMEARILELDYIIWLSFRQEFIFLQVFTAHL